jgi:GH15 family glucan-1,4-alpha-glucosidase
MTVAADGCSLAMPHVLREYALLADGERGVLVGPRGDFAWMCFPRWDSDAVFSTLVGGRGVYAVTPREHFVWGGYYEAGTLIWRSRWVTSSNAIVECREALALPAGRQRAVLLRRVSAERGRATVDVTFDPRGGFGAQPMRSVRRDDAGVWHGHTGEVHVSWSGAATATPEPDGHGGRRLRTAVDLDEGEQHDFILTFALDAAGAAPPDPDAAWSETESAWGERVPALDHTVAPRDARHAYAVLAGLTSLGGGMLAAATTSLPERASAGRNYDYRYVWIRDQCYAGQAVGRAGPLPLLDEAVRFVQERLLEHGPQLRPAYTTTGGNIPDERRLDLAGYPGGADVVGNHVGKQFQLDTFGESLLLLAAAAGHDRLEADGWRAAETAAEAIAARWREPDAGLWELDADEWTHSRLTCAAGLRAIGNRRPGGSRVSEWLALADAITADVSSRAVHRSGRWQRSPSDERVDAALLLPAIRGGIPHHDPRSLKTIEAVEQELTEDGYAYRYRPDERPLGQAEGAFLLCGFILSLAFLQQGRAVDAARWFERNRTACGPPGLLSEEFDVTQRQLRGNLPQAFVHALLLECAVQLAAGPGSG